MKTERLADVDKNVTKRAKKAAPKKPKKHFFKEVVAELRKVTWPTPVSYTHLDVYKRQEDIIAGIALYRPGPMDQIPRYLENRNHPENIKYTDPCLEPILNVTYGCMIYQEQVMQIVRDIAGYSYGRSDLIRRAMSKKKAVYKRQVWQRNCFDSRGQRRHGKGQPVHDCHIGPGRSG